MKTWKSIALCAACLATLSLTAPDLAEAARIGGGRSFGSSSIMSRPATPPSGAFRSGSSSVNRQAPLASSRTDGGAATMTRSNTGLFGGLFGGLLAGTMLGSLLGGTGVGGMMGGFMNLLLLGLLVYFGQTYVYIQHVRAVFSLRYRLTEKVRHISVPQGGF